MKKDLTPKNYRALNKVMYENMTDNLNDLKRSVQSHKIGNRVTYYAYLLAMMRLVIDFTGIASAEQNYQLIVALDKMYQPLHAMLIKADRWFAVLNVTAPYNRRAQIGELREQVLIVRKALIKDGTLTDSTKPKGNEAKHDAKSKTN